MHSHAADVELVFNKHEYLVSLVDKTSGKIIRQKKDHLGHHIAGVISDDLKTVVYITTDRHLWFPPQIRWWDLETDEVTDHTSSHHIYTQWLNLACHFESRLVVLGGIDGFSAFDVAASRTSWHRTSERADKKRAVYAVSISDRGGLVCILQKRRFSIRSALTGDVLKQQLLSKSFMECEFQDDDSRLVLIPPDDDELLSIPLNASALPG